jgi:hypothetical protein
MDMDTMFEDDFNDVPGIQPSGSIHLTDAPDLSQSAWYDLEDELPYDEKQVQHGSQNSSSQHLYRSTAKSHHNWAQASLKSSTSTTPSRWQNLFSLRSIAILIALLALASGVAFARGLTPHAAASVKQTTQQTPLATQSMPAPSATIIATPAKPTAIPSATAIAMSVNPTTTPTQAVSATATGMPTIQNLPPEWTASGRGTVELLEALTVAETFTQRYQTVDFRSLSTLSTARFLLTNAANARFSAKDQRASAQFATQIQQAHLSQAALITGAQLVMLQMHNGNFFAWITVSYQLAIQQGQGTPLTMDNRQMSILLVAAPFGTPQASPPMGGIGWLVSCYGEGNTQLTVSNTP